MRRFKKLISLLMAAVLLMSFAILTPASAATPRLNNVLVTSETFFISSDGVAEIAVVYTGYENVTKSALVEVTLERKTLFWWSEVATWTVGMNGWENAASTSIELTKTGEYRAFFEYTISGSGGEDDVFSFYLYDEYE